MAREAEQIQGYGRDFAIRDPFGNAIRIGSILAYA